jgi:hypothetical protein
MSRSGRSGGCARKSQARPPIHPGPGLERRHDVEHRQLGHPLRVVESQPVRHASAPIVAHDGESLESQARHDLQLVPGHDPLRIRAVSRIGRGATTVPVAAEVRADHREAAGEFRRDAVPASVGLRVPVEQEDGRALTSDHCVDLGLARNDALLTKARKQDRIGLAHLRGTCRGRSGRGQLTSCRGWRSGRHVVQGWSPTASARLRDPK